MDPFAKARRKLANRDTDTAPKPLSARFREELDLLSAQMDIERGVQDPLDMLRLLDLFDRLFEEGEAAHPNFISQYLTESHGWDAQAAEKVAYTWDVVVGLRNLHHIRRTGRR